MLDAKHGHLHRVSSTWSSVQVHRKNEYVCWAKTESCKSFVPVPEAPGPAVMAYRADQVSLHMLAIQRKLCIQSRVWRVPILYVIVRRTGAQVLLRSRQALDRITIPEYLQLAETAHQLCTASVSSTLSRHYVVQYLVWSGLCVRRR